jgi:hypothetical protein
VIDLCQEGYADLICARPAAYRLTSPIDRSVFVVCEACSHLYDLDAFRAEKLPVDKPNG